ncbi:hypothetical protein ABD70_04305 [Alkalihalobacillus lehensis]|nr:hypothetical protein [Shouchella lehensis]
MPGHWGKYVVLLILYILIGIGMYYFFDGNPFPIVFLSLGIAFWLIIFIWIKMNRKKAQRKR